MPPGERTERVKVLAHGFCAKREGLKLPVFLTHPLLPGLLQVCTFIIRPTCHYKRYCFLSCHLLSDHLGNRVVGMSDARLEMLKRIVWR